MAAADLYAPSLGFGMLKRLLHVLFRMPCPAHDSSDLKVGMQCLVVK
jgi:hypothetical protein